MKLQATLAGLLSSVLTAGASAQPLDIDELLRTGVAQLEAARAQHTDAAYQAAEDTFTKLITVTPDHAQALAHRGSARVMRGVLTLKTSLSSAVGLFQLGMSDMDRAVVLAPNDLTVRLTRGLSYVEFPPSYNKHSVAQEDLEIATRHQYFDMLPTPLREQTLRALERARSSPGPSARRMRKDRFPGIDTAVSPVIAVASVTLGRVRPEQRPIWLDTIMAEILSANGLLGVHTAASFDYPGMFLVFTWWENKQALNDFYYSEQHQSWVRGRAGSISSMTTTTYVENVPSQVGIELLGLLPGGSTVGGGFVPPGVRVR